MIILTILLAATLSVSSREADNYRRTGGEIPARGSFKGKVALIDTQSRMSYDDIEKVAATLTEATGCNFVAEKSVPGNPVDLKIKSGADVAAIIIDEASQPVMLVAPEDHWGVLNVAKLTPDLQRPADIKKRFKNRAVKQLIRTVSFLCGGGSSQFPGNMMNAATLKELDDAPDGIPYDMKSHYQRYLTAIGVTPIEYTTYRKACREGWAPAPTNDVQKAIWDKVRSMPEKPIKIKFDPKRDAGK